MYEFPVHDHDTNDALMPIIVLTVGIYVCVGVINPRTNEGLDQLLTDWGWWMLIPGYIENKVRYRYNR